MVIFDWRCKKWHRLIWGNLIQNHYPIHLIFQILHNLITIYSDHWNTIYEMKIITNIKILIVTFLKKKQFIYICKWYKKNSRTLEKVLKNDIIIFCWLNVSFFEIKNFFCYQKKIWLLSGPPNISHNFSFEFQKMMYFFEIIILNLLE